jgi:Domain of unknown function (DUF4389)
MVAVSDSGGDYPATLDIPIDESVHRWGPMFQWILAIPHFLVLYVLMAVGGIVAFISWFIILFTGKMPEGMANLECMALRYLGRTNTYAAGLRHEYPPFEFATTQSDPGVYPTRVNFAPALEGRNRLTVGLRLIWMIPALIVAYIIGIIAFVCWFIAAFAVLFTGHWPDGLRSWVQKGLRAYLRLYTYTWLLTDEYPPLTFD